MLKRVFDFLFSGIGLLFLLPFFIIISILIILTSKGGILYKQERVGLNGKLFSILKFRTMHTGSDKKGLLTVGKKDPRVTWVGYYLRKSKFDELPQLINVFLGEMSLVGPRPEVPKYVKLYTQDDKVVFTVRPGITDYASIQFRNENSLLEDAPNPEKTYVNEIMPLKLRLNKEYIEDQSIFNDIKIIFITFLKILK